MKNYTITVNGNVYDVAVEEGGAEAAAPVARTTSAPKTAPKAAPKAGAAGSVKITAPMIGKVLGIKVNVGDKVTKGQVMIIFEAMKMENEVVATQDGTVASINVKVGDSIEAGDLLASLN